MEDQDNKDIENPKESLESGLIRSIAKNELKDIGTELGEVAIDSFLDEGILKEIPVIGIAAKVYSAGATISGKLFERKVLKFLYELNRISLQNRDDFVAKIQNDPKHEKKVGEHLIILLERLDDMEKPKIIAKIFAEYIEDKIDFEMFLRLSSAVDRTLVSDLNRLKEFKTMQNYSYSAISLENVGLVYLAVISGGNYDEEGNQTGGNQYATSELGNTLLSIIQ